MKKEITKQLNDALMEKHLPNIETTHFFNLFTIKSVRYIKIIFLFLLVAVAQKAAAQSGNVNITIVDEYNKPIAGVSVSSVSNTEKIGVTDLEGNLTLEIEPAGFLKVIHHTKEKMVAINSKSIRIQLRKSDAKINVGYGITKNDDETTTAIDLVYSDKLQKSSLNNPTESLYGKLKGLTVLQNGGEPWSRDPSLFIRGIGTTGNNRILVLVDGFERDLSSLSL